MSGDEILLNRNAGIRGGGVAGANKNRVAGVAASSRKHPVPGSALQSIDDTVAWVVHFDSDDPRNRDS